MEKLTLSADREVIEEARRLAKKNGTSISAMFERIVMLMSRGEGVRNPIGPLTKRASGIVSLPARKTDQQVLEDALLDKYGLKP